MSEHYCLGIHFDKMKLENFVGHAGKLHETSFGKKFVISFSLQGFNKISKNKVGVKACIFQYVCVM